MEQRTLFDVEERPISEYSRTIIIESLVILAQLGTSEKIPHVRTAMKEYFDQLKSLVEELDNG